MWARVWKTHAAVEEVKDITGEKTVEGTQFLFIDKFYETPHFLLLQMRQEIAELIRLVPVDEHIVDVPGPHLFSSGLRRWMLTMRPHSRHGTASRLGT